MSKIFTSKRTGFKNYISSCSPHVFSPSLSAVKIICFAQYVLLMLDVIIIINDLTIGVQCRPALLETPNFAVLLYPYKLSRALASSINPAEVLKNHVPRHFRDWIILTYMVKETRSPQPIQPNFTHNQTAHNFFVIQNLESCILLQRLILLPNAAASSQFCLLNTQVFEECIRIGKTIVLTVEHFLQARLCR